LKRNVFVRWVEGPQTGARGCNRPVTEMETNHISKSTLSDESRQEKGDTKTCLFCGFRYYFRTIRAQDHLGPGNVSKKKVQQCKPSVEHIERHAQVVKEVQERDEYEKIQAREMGKRSVDSDGIRG